MPSLSFTLAPIHGSGIVGARLGDLPCAVFQAANEATLVAFVAHAGTECVDLKKDGIAVAIGGYFLDHQAVTGTFALQPKLVAGAAIKGGEAGLHGFAEGFLIHEAD